MPKISTADDARRRRRLLAAIVRRAFLFMPPKLITNPRFPRVICMDYVPFRLSCAVHRFSWLSTFLRWRSQKDLSGIPEHSGRIVKCKQTRRRFHRYTYCTVLQKDGLTYQHYPSNAVFLWMFSLNRVNIKTSAASKPLLRTLTKVNNDVPCYVRPFIWHPRSVSWSCNTTSAPYAEWLFLLPTEALVTT